MSMLNMKPKLTLTEQQLPAIKNWVTDGVYEVKLKIKQTSSGRSEWDNNRMSATFDIVSVESESKEEQDLSTMPTQQFKGALADAKRKAAAKKYR